MISPSLSEDEREIKLVGEIYASNTGIFRKMGG